MTTVLLVWGVASDSKRADDWLIGAVYTLGQSDWSLQQSLLWNELIVR